MKYHAIFVIFEKKAANFKLSSGHVAYRVKEDSACQQHGSNFLTHRSPTPDPGGGAKSTFSER